MLAAAAAGRPAPGEAPPTLSPSGEDEPAPRIAELRFEAPAWVPEARLRRLAGIGPGDAWTEDVARRTVERLEASRFVAAAGPPRTAPGPAAGEVRVTIPVEPRRIVRQVEIAGNERFSDTSLEELVSTAPGDPVDDEAVEDDRQAVLERYWGDGRLLAHVRVEVDELPLGGARLELVVEEGPRIRLEEVRVLGARVLSRAEVVRASGLRPARGFGILAPGIYRPGTIDEALRRVRLLCLRRGLFDARVGLEEMRVDPGERSLRIAVRIEEGVRHRLAGYELRGRRVFPEELLRREMALETGVPYEAGAVEAAGERLYRWYLDHSDLVPRIGIRHRRAGEGRTVVVYDITEGGHLTVGRVTIRGNTRTRDAAVRMWIDATPGEPYRPREVERSVERLRGTGWFESVEVEERPGAGESVVDLEFRLEEKERTGRIEAGGGAASGEGEVAYVGIRKENFDLFRLPESLLDWRGAFTGGGQRLAIDIVPGSRESEFRALFEEPRLISSRTSLSLSGSGHILQREGWDETRVGGEAEVRHVPLDDPRLTAALAWRAEDVLVDDVRTDAAPDAFAARGHTLLSYPRLSLRWQDLERDPYSGPVGVVAQARLDVADELTGSGFDFLRTTARAELALPVLEPSPAMRHVLRIGAEAGWIRGTGSRPVPIFERFFLGGPRSFRGFRYRRVGPHTGSRPLGGEALLHGTVEYSFPLLIREVRGLLVFDWGNLEPELDRFSTGRFRTALGGGLGLRLPMPFTPQIVPVNLYWTQALTSEPGDAERLFTFWLGLGLRLGR